MSYEIVKTVKFENDTVTITSASNNVYPRTPSTWNMTYRNELNPFTGELAGQVEVLAGYAEGSFQGGSNKFTRALEILLDMPEYQAYNWRNSEYKQKDADYYRLLAKALATKPSKTRYIMYKDSPYSYGQKIYIKRVNKCSISYTHDVTKAKKFTSLREIDSVKASMSHVNYEHEEFNNV